MREKIALASNQYKSSAWDAQPAPICSGRIDYSASAIGWTIRIIEQTDQSADTREPTILTLRFCQRIWGFRNGWPIDPSDTGRTHWRGLSYKPQAELCQRLVNGR